MTAKDICVIGCSLFLTLTGGIAILASGGGITYAAVKLGKAAKNGGTALGALNKPARRVNPKNNKIETVYKEDENGEKIPMTELELLINNVNKAVDSINSAVKPFNEPARVVNHEIGKSETVYIVTENGEKIPMTVMQSIAMNINGTFETINKILKPFNEQAIKIDKKTAELQKLYMETKNGKQILDENGNPIPLTKIEQIINNFCEVTEDIKSLTTTVSPENIEKISNRIFDILKELPNMVRDGFTGVTNNPLDQKNLLEEFNSLELILTNYEGEKNDLVKINEKTTPEELMKAASSASRMLGNIIEKLRNEATEESEEFLNELRTHKNKIDNMILNSKFGKILNEATDIFTKFNSIVGELKEKIDEKGVVKALFEGESNNYVTFNKVAKELKATDELNLEVYVIMYLYDNFTNVDKLPDENFKEYKDFINKNKNIYNQNLLTFTKNVLSENWLKDNAATIAKHFVITRELIKKYSSNEIFGSKNKDNVKIIYDNLNIINRLDNHEGLKIICNALKPQIERIAKACGVNIAKPGWLGRQVGLG